MNEPESTKESDGLGLDKNARLEAKLAAEVKSDNPEPLDIQFPYRVIAIDRTIFRTM